METSINSLTISDIKVDRNNIKNAEGDVVAFSMNCRIVTAIEFRCPTTGLMFRSILHTTEGNALSLDEAVRQAVENLLNNRSYTESNVYNVRVDCIADNKNIHHIDYEHMPPPLDEVFRQLFSKDYVERLMFKN